MQEAFPRLLPHVTRGGEYGIGALAALFDYAVECTLGGGIPDLSVWVPFSRCWEGDNSEIPPDDCMFFEARGVPYSVEPNLHTLRWHGKESATAEPVESIRDVARPIPREEFELLRGSPVAAAKADAKLQAFMASLGMSRADR